MKHGVYWAIWVLLISFFIPSTGFAATVELDRAEFVRMLANIDILKRKLQNADAQIVLHIKGREERETVIALQREHIAELEAMIEDYKVKGESMDKLVEALEQKASTGNHLMNSTSSFVLGMIIAAVIFAVIN